MSSMLDDMETTEQHQQDLFAEYTQNDTNMDQYMDSDDDIDDQDILPEFKQIDVQENAGQNNGQPKTYMRLTVPTNRYTPLRNTWQQICEPVVTHMGLAIRYNEQIKSIELMVTPRTTQPNAIQKAFDFCRAFCLGFELRDAIALLRLDDLYLNTFELKDVKRLAGDNKSRAIGRIAGHGGKTKFTIENATKTRIVMADAKVHILGSFQNIRIARRALSRLVIGAPPGKIYNQMKNVAARNKHRF